MYPFIGGTPNDKLEVSMLIDGAPVTVSKAYSSRGLQHSHCFMGFYLDASGMDSSTHSVSLNLPRLEPGQFQGLFWENVETVTSVDVAHCEFNVH